MEKHILDGQDFVRKLFYKACIEDRKPCRIVVTDKIEGAHIYALVVIRTSERKLDTFWAKKNDKDIWFGFSPDAHYENYNENDTFESSDIDKLFQLIDAGTLPLVPVEINSIQIGNELRSPLLHSRR